MVENFKLFNDATIYFIHVSIFGSPRVTIFYISYDTNYVVCYYKSIMLYTIRITINTNRFQLNFEQLLLCVITWSRLDVVDSIPFSFLLFGYRLIVAFQGWLLTASLAKRRAIWLWIYVPFDIDSDQFVCHFLRIWHPWSFHFIPWVLPR